MSRCPAIVSSRERLASVYVGKYAVSLRPGICHAPFSTDFRKSRLVEEFRTVRRTTAHLDMVAPSLCGRGKHRHCVRVVYDVSHFLVVAANRYGVALIHVIPYRVCLPSNYFVDQKT